jgi:hypothetical protein
MTSLECYENKWFHMKYIGKMAETESLLSLCCILTFNAKKKFKKMTKLTGTIPLIYMFCMN